MNDLEKRISDLDNELAVLRKDLDLKVTELANAKKQLEAEKDTRDSLNDEIKSRDHAFRLINEELERSRIVSEETSKQFRLLVENAPEAIFIQVNGRFAYLNEAAVKLYGARTHDDLLGTLVLDRIPDEFKNLVTDRIEKINNSLSKAGKIEYKHLRVDGNAIDVEVSAVPLRFNNEDGALVFINDISARKKVENKLVESERILKLFVEHAPASIAMFDKTMTYLAVSRRFAEDYKLKVRDLVGKCHYEIFPEIPERWKQIHQRCLNGAVEKNENDPFVREDGRIDWIRWEIHPWYGNNGEIGGIILFSEVITERKNSETEILDSREKLSRALDKVNESYDLLKNLTAQVPGVVYQYRLYPDGHSAFPYSSPGMYEIYEVTPEEVKEDASLVFTRLHPDDYDNVSKLIFESARNLSIFDCKFRVNLPAQGLRWRQSYAKPELLPDGSTLWYGIITDITARVEIESELEHRNLELRTFFNCALDLLCIAETNGSFVRLNKEWENVLGYKLEELEKSRFLDYVHPDDLELTLQSVKHLSDQQTVTDFVNRYRCKDGSYRWIEWRSYPYGNRIYAAARDITARIKTEEQLILAKEKAEESDRLKTAFLQNMSHEIRTPMNAIVGFAGLLPDHFNNKSKLEHFSSIINQRCSDLLAIINDILDIARIESGQLSLNPEICSINSLFGELHAFFTEERIKLKKQHIEFSLKDKTGIIDHRIITDGVKLKQILINLLVNAFKFTDKGRIEGGCTIENGKLKFYVADTGIGIQADKHDIIFERFSQLQSEKSRLYGGTGLGLSIVKGLVGILGGETGLESEPGKGSTFWFTIDYRQYTQGASEVPAVTERPVRFTGKKVLVVEDDTFNSELIGVMLDDLGLELSYAYCGLDAVRLSGEIKPDLILMDIGLPDITGHEAVSRILASQPEMLIVAQTAYADEDNRARAYNAGCVDFIVKPLQSNILMKVLDKYLL